MEDEVKIAPRTLADAPWIREMFIAEWRGDDVVLADGSVIDADDVPALVAWRAGERVGLVAYLLTDEACEIVALVARPVRQGVGTKLVSAAVDLAREGGCARVEVATTNDNVDALSFYQRRGFALAELHPRMMDEVRRRKPEVPLVGAHGIPLRDVIVLRRELG